ncbi:hypothetical protein MTO96_004620 [Rhipicephalus appendiculatus]
MPRYEDAGYTGRWAALLARQVVTPARNHGEHEEKVFSEGKPEEADDGEKLNKGEVDVNEYREEAGGDAEISTTAEAGNINRKAQAIVHDADNRDVDVDSEYEAAAAEAGAATRTPECAAVVDAKTQAEESVAAAFVAEAMEDALQCGEADAKKPAAPKTKPAFSAAVRTEPATVDNEPSGNPQVSGLANTTQALFCEHEPGSTLCESRDKAEVAMAAATKTTAAAKKAKSPTTKSRPAAARSPSWTSMASPVGPTSAARLASTGAETKSDSVEDNEGCRPASNQEQTPVPPAGSSTSIFVECCQSHFGGSGGSEQLRTDATIWLR